MATTWTYSDWRSQDGATAQRTRLLLHIQEVADRLADWQEQGAQGYRGSRFNLLDYYHSLRDDLKEYNRALGLSIEDEAEDPFIQAKPQI